MKRLVFILGCWIGAAAALGSQSVTLAWDPNPEPDIAGYILYWGIASGNYTNSCYAGNVTNCTISGLVEGVTYYFVCTAFNTSGLESDPSNEVSYAVPLGVKLRAPVLRGAEMELEVEGSMDLTNWIRLMVWRLTNNWPLGFYQVK